MSGQAGVDCVLKVGANEVVEARDVTVTVQVQTVEDTSRASDGWKSFIAGLGTWSVSFNAVSARPWSTSLTALKTSFVAREPVEDVTMTDAEGYGWSGEVIVTQFAESQPLTGVVTVSVTLQGRGAPEQVTP